MASSNSNVKTEPGIRETGAKKEIKVEGKVRKKRDRFKGMSEEEVLKRELPDHLAPNLDILIIGINPGLTAAFVGHHYAGPGNHMWKCLFLSGLIPTEMNAYDDFKLLDFGIGFTNIVARTSRGSADLSKKEIKEGGEILKEKVRKLKPKIAVFNGKGIYEVFIGHKKFSLGKQPGYFPECEDTVVFVMPSSSARFTQLPRAIDKVPFYLALKKYRDYLKDSTIEINEEDFSFPEVNLRVVPKAVRLAKEKAEAEANGQVWPPCHTESKKMKTEEKMRQSTKQDLKLNDNYCDQKAAATSFAGIQFDNEKTGNVQQAANSVTSTLDCIANGESVLTKAENITELIDYGIIPSNLKNMSGK